MRCGRLDRRRRTPPPPRTRATRVLAALAMMVLLPLHAAAQMSTVTDGRQGAGAGWGDELRYAAANALLGGVIAGLFQAFSDDGSFVEGFGVGAAGGFVTYGGKQVAARRFAGAGLLGRQIASLGGSVTANARDGTGPLDRVTIQLGLGRLYWDRTRSSVVFRPDVATLYYTALAAARSGVGLDWSHTLSAGTPVFHTEPGVAGLGGNAAGRAFGGVVLIDANARLHLDDVAAHERIHVLQYDQQFALWGDAAERKLGSMFGQEVASVLGRMDLSIGLVPVAPLLYYVPRDSNPFELEARHMTGALRSVR